MTSSKMISAPLNLKPVVVFINYGGSGMERARLVENDGLDPLQERGRHPRKKRPQVSLKTS